MVVASCFKPAYLDDIVTYSSNVPVCTAGRRVCLAWGIFVVAKVVVVLLSSPGESH